MINIKKINIADFSSENTEDMQKLARSLNPFFDSISQILKKGLTVSEHLPFEYLTFDVEVDASGVPKSSIKLPTSLNATIQGMIVIKVDSTGTPTAAPFIIFSINKKIITITKVVGLPANVIFKLTVMVGS